MIWVLGENGAVNKKNQSVIEYLLIFAVVTLVVLAVANGSFPAGLKSYFDKAGENIGKISLDN